MNDSAANVRAAAGKGPGQAADSIKPRSVLLDAARGWAILGVAIHHSGQAIPNLPLLLDLFSKSGQYGVQLFFVISALTIFHTLQRSANGTVSRWECARAFWIKRFFRIAPIYYLGLLYYWLFWFLGAAAFKLDFIKYYTPLNIIANLLFVHSLVPTAANNIVVPGGWSIGVEMMFYLIAPAVFYFIQSKRAALKAAITAFLLGTLGTACISYYTKGTFRIVNDSFLYFWFFSQFYIFFLGYALYLRFKDVLFRQPSLTLFEGVSSLAVSILLYCIAVIVGWWLDISHALALLLIALASCLFLLSLATRNLTILTSKPFVKLGQVSYSVYISHFAIQMPILFLSRRSHFVHELFGRVPIIALLLTTAAVLGGSYLIAVRLNRWIELPFIDIGHRLAARTAIRANGREMPT